MESTPLSYKSAAGRWVIAATVLGSSIVFLDQTALNVALPVIERELHAGFAGLQWIVDAYLLVLGSFLLLGGSLGDLFGRRRVFVIGLIWFATASALCALSPSAAFLVAGRALQGLGAALLVPGSLAIIAGSFRPSERGVAIGTWSGLSAVTTALGPLLGGWLVDAASWRFVFLINPPLAALTVWMAVAHVPETKAAAVRSRLDVPGALTATLALAGLVYAPIEAPLRGWSDPVVIGVLIASVILICLFVFIESHSRHPMLPLSLFRSRRFSGANLTTLAVYGALNSALFLLVLELERSMSYSAFFAGLALLPITVLLLTISPTAGRLTQRLGPRPLMTVGPLLAAIGLALLARVGPAHSYLATVFPGITIFALGLSLTVAPLTTAVVTGVKSSHAGIASGVNNAASRVAGLLAVAVVPLLAGIARADQQLGAGLTSGFRRAMLITAFLCVLGAVASFTTLKGTQPAEVDEDPAVETGRKLTEGQAATLGAEVTPLRPTPEETTTELGRQAAGGGARGDRR